MLGLGLAMPLDPRSAAARPTKPTRQPVRLGWAGATTTKHAAMWEVSWSRPASVCLDATEPSVRHRRFRSESSPPARPRLRTAVAGSVEGSAARRSRRHPRDTRRPQMPRSILQSLCLRYWPRRPPRFRARICGEGALLGRAIAPSATRAKTPPTESAPDRRPGQARPRLRPTRDPDKGSKPNTDRRSRGGLPARSPRRHLRATDGPASSRDRLWPSSHRSRWQTDRTKAGPTPRLPCRRPQKTRSSETFP